MTTSTGPQLLGTYVFCSLGEDALEPERLIIEDAGQVYVWYESRHGSCALLPKQNVLRYLRTWYRPNDGVVPLLPNDPDLPIRLLPYLTAAILEEDA